MTIITGSTQSTPVASLPKRGDMSSDFNTFLTMLSAQMRNQDPLNPIESADYATQLATFSGVEQQVLTNDLLREMIATRTQSNVSQLSGWVGKEVSAPGTVNFDGSPLTLDVRPAATATTVAVEIQTEGGALIQTLPAPTAGGATDWGGTKDDGTPLPAGRYRFVTVSYNGETEIARRETPVYQSVREVRLEAGGPMLVLAGGSRVSPDSITALRQP